MKYLSIIILFVVTFVSCKSGCNITEATALHDTLYVNNYQRDSIYLHDSIYNEVYYSGDTVFITKDHWHTAYRDRVKIDTLYHTVRDTVTVFEQRQIKHQLTWWQEFFITLGEIAFFMIIALVLIYAVRLL